MCVERTKQCDDISALSRELDIDRRLLYRWRDQFDPPKKSEWPPPQNSRESNLIKEVSQLKRERRLWREGIYDQIREVMSLQGSLSIEWMCQLAQVSRAGFYRSLQKRLPRERRDGSALHHAADRPRTSAPERTLATRLTESALEQAIAARQARQAWSIIPIRLRYASNQYVPVLLAHQMIPSMSRPTNPYNNASCESFMMTIKREASSPQKCVANLWTEFSAQRR